MKNRFDFKGKMKWYKMVVTFLAFIILISTSIDAHAGYVVNWQDEAYTSISGNEQKGKIANAHPFHYYVVYNWDYAKKATQALQKMQTDAGKPASPENNYTYYMAMLRAVELGLDGGHAHQSPAHGNIYSRMNFRENHATNNSENYSASLNGWKKSEGHYSRLLTSGKENKNMAYGATNGGSVTVFTTAPSSAVRSAQTTHIIKGMDIFKDPYTDNPQYTYRIQLDETDFTTNTLSGITRFEDTYYQAAQDDINHVISGWLPCITDKNGNPSHGNVTGANGDTFTFCNKLYPRAFDEAKTVNELDKLTGAHYNNCYVCLGLDNFIVTSSNPKVVSVKDNILTLHNSGEYNLIFTYKYNTQYSFNIGCAATLVSPTSATTDKTIKTGVKVNTSDAEYKVTKNTSNTKTVTYTKPTNASAIEVSVPDSIKINGTTYKVTSIDKQAYANNKAVRKVTIGKNVTSIGTEAFKGCTSLTSVVFGRKVKTIGTRAFYGCNSLTKAALPKSVTSIGKEAFRGCTKLASLSCSGVKTVGTKAFYGCTSLTKISLSKVTTIKEKAFASCTSLTKATFGSNLTTIGSRIFDKDLQLKTVYIKSTKVKKVSKSSFSGTPKSTKLYLRSSKKQTYKKLFKYAKVKKVYKKKV